MNRADAKAKRGKHLRDSARLPVRCQRALLLRQPLAFALRLTLAFPLTDAALR